MLCTDTIMIPFRKHTGLTTCLVAVTEYLSKGSNLKKGLFQLMLQEDSVHQDRQVRV